MTGKPSMYHCGSPVPIFEKGKSDMDILRRTDVGQLMETNGNWHVSIYLPTHRAGNEQQQNPIRFKNLLNGAEKKLTDYDVRRPEVEEMLRSVTDLLADPIFWQHQSDGLAVFLSKDLSRIYRLPAGFDEAVVVGKSFYVQPLLPLLNGNGNFYILALSINQTKLFQASKDDINEVELKDMPKNMEDALMIEDKQKNIGFQTMTQNTVGGTGAERPAIHYGQGVEDDKKEKILRYCQEVDNGISRVMDDESAPMLVAAVDYLIPIFQQASTYRNLLNEGVVGSPEQHNPRNYMHSPGRLSNRFSCATSRKRSTALTNYTVSKTDSPPATWIRRSKLRSEDGSKLSWFPWADRDGDITIPRPIR